MVNPYLFVVGAARSGTTLLQRMLDAHPLLAVVNETYWVPRKSLERYGLTREGYVTPELLPQLLANPRFERIGLIEADLQRLSEEDPPVPYARFVSRIFDCYAERQGKKLAGDKTPGYVRKLERIHQAWPEARFVHIIRDPRDLCLSMVDWSSGERTAGQYGTWEQDPAVSTALYWRYSVALGRDAAVALGDRLYTEIRYEDLVADPGPTLGRLCAFLDLPYDDAITRFHEGRVQPGPGRTSKEQWLPPTVGLRDWRDQLDRSITERVEVAAGDLLEGCGYERLFSNPGPEARARVSEIRDTFTHNALAKERPIPAGW